MQNREGSSWSKKHPLNFHIAALLPHPCNGRSVKSAASGGMLRRKWASAWKLFGRGNCSETAIQSRHRASSSVGVAAQCTFPRSSGMAGLALREAPSWERVGRRAQVWPYALTLASCHAFPERIFTAVYCKGFDSRLTSQMAQGHPFVMFALGGAVGAAASQGYALLPRQPLTCLLAVLVRHAVMCTVHHATPSTCTCLTQEKDEVAWSTQQRKKLCEAGAATSANAAKWLLLHDMPCLFRYGLVKWDGTALCDSALQSLSAKLSSLSADVRAWGGVPFAYCTLGLAGLILG